MNNECVFSPCRSYRYLLRHSWMIDDLLQSEPEKAVAWIGLNPSTADETQLDPTLRRIKGFSELWGFNTFYMLNVFAFRATDPAVMKAQQDPNGPENDFWIRQTAAKVPFVVAAWGNHGSHLDRSAQVLELLKGFDLRYLKMTGKNQPSHPLYIPQDTKPLSFS